MYFIFNKICLFIIAVYDLLLYYKIIQTHRFSVPVVSVGNISIGGSGKTPFIYYLCKILIQHNIKPVIVSRGYKKQSKGPVVVHNGKSRVVSSPSVCGDEPFMLANKLSDVPIVVDNKKFRAIQLAIDSFGPQIILLDDGFQSKYIKKNLDIVLFNTFHTKSDLKFFPFGKLRDDLKSLQKADLVIFTKNNLSSKKNMVVSTLLPVLRQKNIPYIYSQTSFSLMRCPLKKDGDSFYWGCSQPIERLNNQDKLFSFCGIADPASFNKIIKSYSSNIVKHINFSDHYNYAKNENDFLLYLQGLMSSNQKITGLLTTYKDFVKIQNLSSIFLQWAYDMKISFFVIDIEMFVDNKQLILEKIKTLDF